MASDVSDVCLKLQGIQLQLSLVLNRNEEVLKHLAEVEKLVARDDPSLSKDQLKTKVEHSRSITKKLEESIRTQCTNLGEAVKELEQRSANLEGADESSAVADQKSSLEFQLKSQLNHNVRLHQEKAELETRLREHMETLKESGRQADRLEEELVETKRQVKDLLDLFESKAVAAEKRIGELQKAMDGSQRKAQRFQVMYKTERETNVQMEREQLERMRQAEEEGKSVIEDNKTLRAEVERLREDNVHLVKKSKQAQRDIETIQNHVATCSGQRDELRRRLKKEQDEYRKLQLSLTRQASDWVTQKKMVKDIDHHSKVGKVQPESTLNASTKYRSHPIRPSEDKPRNIPVESWSSDNPLRAV